MLEDLELDELKREFLTEAEEKIREMEGSLGGERTSAALDRLAYLAHQLKGSGGSYGYQRISADAAAIEELAEEIARGGGRDGVDAALREHVVHLREEIDRSLRELTK